MDSSPSAPDQVLEIDALIIGAGPVGLYQAFQLGLQGIQAHMVDALPYAGGQCVELYADKPIYDIPGFVICTGRELVNNLLRQLQPFNTEFHFGQLVSQVERQKDGRFQVTTERHGRTVQRFTTKTIFIAAGVGAFEPRKLKVEGLARYEGTQVHYEPQSASRFAGSRLVIVGDGEQALRNALQWCVGTPQSQPALSVTVLHRRDAFSASEETVAEFRSRLVAGHIHFVAGQISGIQADPSTLSSLEISVAEGPPRKLPVDQLLVLQGMSPKMGPIAKWGIAMERRQLLVEPDTCTTSEAGIFAVGDVNTYPGKKKLIVCGFHESVLAAFGAMPIITPGKEVPLEYTTTSSRLHKLLGVTQPESR
jgi:thioredoxin reductase (NADPH)